MDASYSRQGTSLTSEDQSEKLELFISCRNLADLDLVSVTDSFLVVKLSEPNKPQKVILKTKIYWNDLNPDYAETVTLDFFFQSYFRIMQSARNYNLTYFMKPVHRLVGTLNTTLGEIFGSPQNGFKRDIVNQKGKVSGQILVRCEKVAKLTNNLIQFDLQANELPTSFGFFCFGGSTNPFFRIYRVRQRDELLIYESETAYNTSEPRFKRCQLSERRLCKNDPDFPFQIRFYNYSNMGNHTYWGAINSTVNKLIDPRSFNIMDSKNRIKGTAKATKVKRYMKHTFTDFISAGLQLMLINCIDFTASNGSPKNQSSLHYIKPGGKSQYEEALQEVSNILLDYDSDKLVPVYGFGAKVSMPNFNSYGKTHHCFPLNGNEQNSHVFMVQGIIQAYRYSLQYLEFSGPTMFSGLLGQAIAECRQLRKQMNQYMIVFILTDGEIHDKGQVIDQIIECCDLPISLIIVGVGNGPFDIMNELDDDDCQLVDSRGRKTFRDLVQFVEFRKFRNSGMELAREVLQQLPRQVEEYYQIVNISPAQIRNMPPPIAPFPPGHMQANPYLSR